MTLKNKMFLNELAFSLKTSKDNLIDLIEMLYSTKVITVKKRDKWLDCEQNQITKKVYYTHKFTKSECEFIKNELDKVHNVALNALIRAMENKNAVQSTN